VADNRDDDSIKQSKKKSGELSWNQALVVGGLAMTIPGLLFAPPAMGYWIDSVYHTDPWFTVGGFVVGLLGTAIDVWQILRRVGLVE
jgi:F0F1-type ATP synthase assembly protein I